MKKYIVTYSKTVKADSPLLAAILTEKSFVHESTMAQEDFIFTVHEENNYRDPVHIVNLKDFYEEIFDE